MIHDLPEGQTQYDEKDAVAQSRAEGANLTDVFAASFTDAALTEIYNEANSLDPKRHNSITTERIFNAMRECLKVGYAKAANV